MRSKCAVKCPPPVRSERPTGEPRSEAAAHRQSATEWLAPLAGIKQHTLETCTVEVGDTKIRKRSCRIVRIGFALRMPRSAKDQRTLLAGANVG